MCEQEWRPQPLVGAMLLPNLAALARGGPAHVVYSRGVYHGGRSARAGLG